MSASIGVSCGGVCVVIETTSGVGLAASGRSVMLRLSSVVATSTTNAGGSYWLSMGHQSGLLALPSRKSSTLGDVHS